MKVNISKMNWKVDISLCWVPIVKMLPWEHCRLFLLVYKLEVALLFAMPIAIESYYHSTITVIKLSNKSDHSYDHDYHYRWYNDRKCHAISHSWSEPCYCHLICISRRTHWFWKVVTRDLCGWMHVYKRSLFIQLHIYQHCLYQHCLHYHNLSQKSLSLLDITYAYVH